MNADVKNIFYLSSHQSCDEEVFDTLISGKNILIERIISTGQITPEGKWYDQEKDEWVVLLQGTATLSFEEGKIIRFVAGDYLFIPAHRKHRIEETQISPPSIWLAIHADMS